VRRFGCAYMGVIRHSILQQRTTGVTKWCFCSTCWTGDNKRQRRSERRTWPESVAEFFLRIERAAASPRMTGASAEEEIDESAGKFLRPRSDIASFVGYRYHSSIGQI
jgi:hypothetical protein